MSYYTKDRKERREERRRLYRLLLMASHNASPAVTLTTNPFTPGYGSRQQPEQENRSIVNATECSR